MEKPSIAEAVAFFEKLWGLEQHLCTARYHLLKLQQLSGEGINDFISHIHQAIPECWLLLIQPQRTEETMQIDYLIGGVSDYLTRDKLPSKDSGQLIRERVCSITRQRELIIQTNRV
ncbi:unnamed protein product [Echinostoma caproni]|uniref:Retrotrans_gag domain-containing protein n=1 Tax=Echinostoma caproni TaxID=27848 RepID=A0A183ABH6_9TREM|nr:unnamed protein product [Echinostoma caproni]